MKKAILVFLTVLMMLSLCSCQFTEERIDSGYDTPSKQESDKEQNEEKPVEKPDVQETNELTKEEVKALADAALEKLEKIPEYPEGFPTLEDVVSQYKRANEAIGWIVGTEKVATDGDYTLQSHGMTYYKVLPDCYLGAKDAGKIPDAEMLIYNKENLEAYIATLIAKDEAHEYVLDITESFEIPKFVESKNGELYALPYAFPPAGYGENENDTFAMSKNDDGSYTLSVTYDILDDNDEVAKQRVYNVKYVKKDSRWVFENFRVVKQH